MQLSILLVWNLDMIGDIYRAENEESLHSRWGGGGQRPSTNACKIEFPS